MQTIKIQFFTSSSVAKYNGFITVQNPKTGEHRTFRIQSETWNAGKPNEVVKRTVALLSGPDRESSSAWQTFADVRDGEVVVWRSKSSPVFEAFANILNNPDRGIAYGLKYLLEGCCRRCNRRLSNPKSIETGIGPVCAGRE